LPLKPLSYREVRRRLLAVGFAEVSQEGSPVKFARFFETGTRTAIVPRHREIVTNTLRSVLRQAGLSLDEWEAL
jgi:predicted RNA binding protein YcfA (HicA-like mRNA interferase family)